MKAISDRDGTLFPESTGSPHTKECSGTDSVQYANEVVEKSNERQGNKAVAFFFMSSYYCPVVGWSRSYGRIQIKYEKLVKFLAGR